jgi:hypothetical protein
MPLGNKNIHYSQALSLHTANVFCYLESEYVTTFPLSQHAKTEEVKASDLPGCKLKDGRCVLLVFLPGQS